MAFPCIGKCDVRRIRLPTLFITRGATILLNDYPRQLHEPSNRETHHYSSMRQEEEEEVEPTKKQSVAEAWFTTPAPIRILQSWLLRPVMKSWEHTQTSGQSGNPKNTQSLVCLWEPPGSLAPCVYLIAGGTTIKHYDSSQRTKRRKEMLRIIKHLELVFVWPHQSSTFARLASTPRSHGMVSKIQLCPVGKATRFIRQVGRARPKNFSSFKISIIVIFRYLTLKPKVIRIKDHS